MRLWIKWCMLALTLNMTITFNANARVLVASGTLPVLHIDTSGGKAITSKENYIAASMYVEIPAGAIENVGSDAALWAMGSADDPVQMKIRGRGNWTWTGFEKKPYKVKFSTPLSLLGMGENRHWALLSHPEDGTGFLRNALAFEMGRMIGLPFTPHQQPAELVLNGEYMGVYVVTETVRVDNNRVEIDAQEDGEADPEKVKSGWLVEVDNYEDYNQISFDVSGLPLDEFRITWHTPEILSSVQYNYLFDQFTDILNAVYVDDKTSQLWEEYIDIDMLARYYVVAEIIDHVEFFFGSTFLYKASADGKWMTGPMWDIGHGLNTWHDKNKFIYEGLAWGNNLLTELCKFPRLQQRARQLYAWFMREHYEEVELFIDDYCAMMHDACHANFQRWDYYGDVSASEYAEAAKQTLQQKIAFLDKVWGRETGINDNLNDNVNANGSLSAVYDLQGRILDEGLRIKDESNNPSSLIPHLSSRKGIYIVNGKKIMIR